MNNFYSEITKKSTAIVSFIFTIIPESIFNCIQLSPVIPDVLNVFVNRILIVLLIIGACALCVFNKTSTKIKGKNYTIEIKYGDIFRQQNSKVVIPFDECYTTTVGSNPADINSKSICGQYLATYPISDMYKLLSRTGIKSDRISKYNNQPAYRLGTLLPQNNFLLLAFSKLDENGLATMSRDEYVSCLNVLWEEINKYYGQQDVCIPILGSGVTRFGDARLTQQNLLDIMIGSYKLYHSKINNLNKLVIVCRKQEDFSLNKIGESE